MSRLLLIAGLSSLVLSCGNFVDYITPPLCEPQSCEDLGIECGIWSDTCGKQIDCGGCPQSGICHARGECVAECTPSTCQELGLQCGTWDDGCGQQIECGACPLGEACDIGGKCMVTPSNQEDRISTCGGFGGSLFDGPTDYCVAEVLHWFYEPATQTLKIADARILLNCCGDHSMIMEKQGDVYVFTETDAPEGAYGRCACMCVYDYTITVMGVPEEVLSIRIELDVTDDQHPVETVFEGQLDLSLGSGSQIIDETDVGPWCGEY